MNSPACRAPQRDVVLNIENAAQRTWCHALAEQLADPAPTAAAGASDVKKGDCCKGRSDAAAVAAAGTCGGGVEAVGAIGAGHGA